MAQNRAPEPAYDWNRMGERQPLLHRGITLLDETLRDGIQNPSVRDPSREQKLELLHLMSQLGVHRVNAGLPASSKRNFEDTLALCQAIVDEKLAIRPVAAGRTVVSDVEPIVEVAQCTGQCVEVYVFIGSSPIRQYTEGWNVDWVREQSRKAISFAVREGLPVCYVTEDTTRSHPDALRTLWLSAIEHGARRLCLTDTVGHATVHGVRHLVEHARGVIEESGAEVGIDWHGHNDRGLALDNALWALELGADRIHGTALGIGERTGNAPLDRIIEVLTLLGELHTDRTLLEQYRKLARASLDWSGGLPTRTSSVGVS